MSDLPGLTASLHVLGSLPIIPRPPVSPKARSEVVDNKRKYTGSVDSAVEVCRKRKCRCKSCLANYKKFIFCNKCIDCHGCSNGRLAVSELGELAKARVLSFCDRCQCQDCKRIIGCSDCSCDSCVAGRANKRAKTDIGEVDSSAISQIKTSTPESRRLKPDNNLKKSSVAPKRKEDGAAKSVATHKDSKLGFALPPGTTNLCAVSWVFHNSERLQFCHVVARSTSDLMLSKLERSWGIPFDKFNVDSSDNLLSLTPSNHATFDGTVCWGLVPVDLNMVKQMAKFAKNKQMNPASKEKITEIYSGKKAFRYRLVPFEGLDAIIPRIEHAPLAKHETVASTNRRYPYKDFPELQLHILPHYAVYNVVNKAKERNGSEEHLDRWFSHDGVDLSAHWRLCTYAYKAWMSTALDIEDLKTVKGRLRGNRKHDLDDMRKEAEAARAAAADSGTPLEAREAARDAAQAAVEFYLIRAAAEDNY